MLKIYQQYEIYGVDNFYKKFSKEYFNPHEEKIDKVYRKFLQSQIKKTDKILDIASGDGLMARLIKKHNMNNNVDGCDPYFSNEFTQLNLSFEQIAQGELSNLKKFYDIAICSYAFHLLDKNWHYDFLRELGLITNKFIIITPSKKIYINHFMWDVKEYIRDDKISLIILVKKEF